MNQFFNYNTLDVKLDRETKSLTILLKDSKNRLSKEMLYELETLTAWLTNHIEINSVVFTSASEYFIQGIGHDEIMIMDTPKFQTMLRRIQTLVHNMFYLPQTIIFDLKKGAAGVGIELSIAADVRLIHDSGSLHFNHLEDGFAPSSGGISLAGLVLPKNIIRGWTMAGEKVEANDLKAAGFIYKSYKSKVPLQNILATIAKQAPVQRIQAKRSFLQDILAQLKPAMEHEQNFAQAGIVTQDWKSKVTTNEFLGAQEFAAFLKKSDEEMSQQTAN